MADSIVKNLDFRSDTVTLPTPAMRKAAAEAPVGDDVQGEDPSVNELESLAAEMLGKEEGLFVTSGTQGNAVSVLAHTQRGDEIIVETGSHIHLAEVGGPAVMGGVMVRPVKGELGWIRPDDLEAAIRQKNIHYPKTSLVCVENTHNTAGGIPLTPEQLKADWEIAKNNGLNVHMDGARVFNAAIALGIDVKKIAQFADSVMFCLSKGLSAPVGSVVVGSRDFIEKARKYRKMLGGGMRQAGVIAAPGIVALTRMVNRLVEDHENARLLAEGLRQIEGIKIHHPVRTNIVFLDVKEIGWSGQKWEEVCSNAGWRITGGDLTIRLCTHFGIVREDIENFVSIVRKVVNG